MKKIYTLHTVILIILYTWVGRSVIVLCDCL